MSPADTDPHLTAWQASRSRRWAIYWARHARGKGAPWPNSGGFRSPTWRTYWYVGWRGADGRRHVIEASSRGAAKRAVKRAQHRHHREIRMWWCDCSPHHRLQFTP